jgi:hypothetical protein
MPDKLKAVLSLLRRTFARWFAQSSSKTLIDDYRPEHHYMRGPGPKTRLKRAAASEEV